MVTGLGSLFILTFHCLPSPAWADGNFAESAGLLGIMVEHPNQSQPHPVESVGRFREARVYVGANRSSRDSRNPLKKSDLLPALNFRSSTRRPSRWCCPCSRTTSASPRRSTCASQTCRSSRSSARCARFVFSRQIIRYFGAKFKTR